MSLLLSSFLNFINRTVFIRVLGVSFLGINGLFTDILIMLSLADLGLATSMIYSFYRPLANKDNDTLNALVHYYRKIYAKIAILIAVFGLSLLPFLNQVVQFDQSIPHLWLYYLISLANTVISYVFVYKTMILQADQKNYLISRNNILFNTIRSVTQITVVLLTGNYVAYLGIQLLSTFLSNLILSRKVESAYALHRVEGSDGIIDKKELFTNIKSVALYKFSQVVFSGTDNVLISILVGTIWVGYYSNYNLVIASIASMISILYVSVSASIGNVIEVESAKKKLDAFDTIQMISLWVTTFSTVCLYLLLGDLIAIWLGKTYVLSGIILSAVIFNFYVMGIVQPIWVFREATGIFKETKYIMVLAAIENLILSFILGRYFGIAGIIFATAVSRLTTYFWYEPRILFKEHLKQSSFRFYRSILINAFLTLCLILVLQVVLKPYVIDSWGKLVVKTGVIVVITLSSIFVIYHKNQQYQLVINRIKALLVRA